MVIKVEISEETWARMLTGRRVEGTLGYDLMTGKKDFNAYKRSLSKRRRDVLVKKLPWGWLKKSQQKWKTYISVDSDMPLDQMLKHFQNDHDAAMEAIVDCTIIGNA